MDMYYDYSYDAQESYKDELYYYMEQVEQELDLLNIDSNYTEKEILELTYKKMDECRKINLEDEIFYN